MGEDGVKNFLAHAEQRKAAGEKLCDCPACSACAEILSKKDELRRNSPPQSKSDRFSTCRFSFNEVYIIDRGFRTDFQTTYFIYNPVTRK